MAIIQNHFNLFYLNQPLFLEEQAEDVLSAVAVCLSVSTEPSFCDECYCKKRKKVNIANSVNTISDIDTIKKMQNKVKHDYIEFVNWSENRCYDHC